MLALILLAFIATTLAAAEQALPASAFWLLQALLLGGLPGAAAALAIPPHTPGLLTQGVLGVPLRTPSDPRPGHPLRTH